MLLILNIFNTFTLNFIYLQMWDTFWTPTVLLTKGTCFLYSYTKLEIWRGYRNICWSLAEKEWDKKGNTENPSSRALCHSMLKSAANLECVFPLLFHSRFSSFLVGALPTKNVPRLMTGFFSFSTGNFFSNIIFRFSHNMWTVDKTVLPCTPQIILARN